MSTIHDQTSIYDCEIDGRNLFLQRCVISSNQMKNISERRTAVYQSRDGDVCSMKRAASPPQHAPFMLLYFSFTVLPSKSQCSSERAQRAHPQQASPPHRALCVGRHWRHDWRTAAQSGRLHQRPVCSSLSRGIISQQRERYTKRMRGDGRKGVEGGGTEWTAQQHGVTVCPLRISDDSKCRPLTTSEYKLLDCSRKDDFFLWIHSG